MYFQQTWFPIVRFFKIYHRRAVKYNWIVFYLHVSKSMTDMHRFSTRGYAWLEFDVWLRTRICVYNKTGSYVISKANFTISGITRKSNLLFDVLVETDFEDRNITCQNVTHFKRREIKKLKRTSMYTSRPARRNRWP